MKPAVLLDRLVAGRVRNIAFRDVKRLAEALGFKELRHAGSHHLCGRDDIPELLNLDDRRGHAEPYQLAQLVSLVRRYDLRVKEHD